MVGTPDERVSTESGDSGRLRCGANIGARQHAGKSVSVKTPQTIAEPVVKPTSTSTMVIVPV
jgi:hypothetical protein